LKLSNVVQAIRSYFCGFSHAGETGRWRMGKGRGREWEGEGRGEGLGASKVLRGKSCSAKQAKFIYITPHTPALLLPLQ
jgi:hypothetical protein